MHVHAHHHQAHFVSVFSLLATVVKRFTNMSSICRKNFGGRNRAMMKEEEGEEIYEGH